MDPYEKDSLLWVAKKALSIALRNSEVVAQLSDSFTEAQVVQLDKLMELRISEPAADFVKAEKLEMQDSGDWRHAYLVIEGGEHEKTAWLMEIPGGEGPPILELTSLNSKEVIASGKFSFLGKTIEMKDEKFGGGREHKMPIDMSRDEFRQATRNGKPISMGVDIRIHDMK